MGNIRSTYIKRIAKELINMYPDKFVASDFQHNKEKVAELADFDSKIVIYCGIVLLVILQEF